MTKLSDRFLALFEHLGLERAHVLAGAFVTDAFELLGGAPDTCASQALVCPSALPLRASEMLTTPTLLFSGDSGSGIEECAVLAARSGTVQLEVLPDFSPLPYTDTVAERRDEILGPLMRFLRQAQAQANLPSASGADESGSVEGIVYRARGNGPPLVVFPIMLAPSQGSPILDDLAQEFRVTRVSGVHLSPVANFERSRNLPGFRGIVELALHHAPIEPGKDVLEIGCGSGAICRLLAERSGGPNRIVGQDINAFLVEEAQAIVQERPELARLIRFEQGDAEALAYADDRFGAVVSVTMLEEVDADRTLSEMVRVTEPGGVVVVIVRALDVAVFVSPEISAALHSKIAAAIYAPGVGPAGCADGSLYERMASAGLTDIVGSPQHVPGMQHWLAPRLRPQLDESELREFDHALERPWFNVTVPTHMCVGRKP